jgi:bifunctional DNase/RNase
VEGLAAETEAPDARDEPAALAPEAPVPAAGPPGAAPPAVVRRAYRIMRVASVDVTLPDQFPMVVLEDLEGRGERLAFRIGMAEGVALAHSLAATTAPRPLTHDLFALALERYGVEIVAVRLTGRIGATYLAEIELTGLAGREVLSCRPSDGICLALRQRVPAPVLCDERLFAASGDIYPDGPVVEGDRAD